MKEWNLVKPKLPYRAITYNSEKVVAQVYDKDPKTIKEHTGKVIGVCICTLSGKVLSIVKGIHADVCEYYGVNPDDVEKSGWELDNGNFVWR